MFELFSRYFRDSAFKNVPKLLKKIKCLDFNFVRSHRKFSPGKTSFPN